MSGVTIGIEKGYERALNEQIPVQRRYEKKLKSEKGKRRKEQKKSMRQAAGLAMAGTGAGALAGGTAAWALTRRKKQEQQLSARLREIRFVVKTPDEYKDSGLKPRDIAIGAVEGGVAPFIEPLSSRLMGKPREPIFAGGWKTFGKRVVIGGALGGVATGAVGYALNKAHKYYAKRKLQKQMNQLSSKAKEVRFGVLARTVTSDYNFAPQGSSEGTGSPIRVVRDRYDKGDHQPREEPQRCQLCQDCTRWRGSWWHVQEETPGCRSVGQP
jgi:hypothetical protein